MEQRSRAWSTHRPERKADSATVASFGCSSGATSEALPVGRASRYPEDGEDHRPPAPNDVNHLVAAAPVQDVVAVAIVEHGLRSDESLFLAAWRARATGRRCRGRDLAVSAIPGPGNDAPVVEKAGRRR
jgi:hypothetical protein